MKTTVIIPNYNGKDFLEECLVSLQKCRSVDFAVLVVDNGSADGSTAMVKERFPAVELVALPKNTGFSGAVNAGLARVKTEYVVLLNNDTTVEPQFVDNLEKAIETDSRIFSVSAKMVVMQQPDILDGTGDLYCALGWAYALDKGKSTQKHGLRKRAVFSTCAGAAIYRTKLLIEMGAFDEAHFAYLEDVDVGYRARIHGYVNRYEPSAICFHAGSGFSGSRYNEFKISLASRNSVYLLYKNMPLLQILLNLPFLLIGFMIKILFFLLKGYGGTYIKGLGTGIRYCFTGEAREKKVHFKWKNMGYYVKIQLQLWCNMIRRLILF